MFGFAILFAIFYLKTKSLIIFVLLMIKKVKENRINVPPEL